MFEIPNRDHPLTQLALVDATRFWEEADPTIRDEVIETGGTPRTDRFAGELVERLQRDYGFTESEASRIIELSAWRSSPGSVERLFETIKRLKEETDE